MIVTFSYTRMNLLLFFFLLNQVYIYFQASVALLVVCGTVAKARHGFCYCLCSVY